MRNAKAIAAIFLFTRLKLTLANAAVDVAPSFALLAAWAPGKVAAFAPAVRATEATALGTATAPTGACVLTPRAPAVRFAATIGLGTTQARAFDALFALGDVAVAAWS